MQSDKRKQLEPARSHPEYGRLAFPGVSGTAKNHN
jgi:hypothetical protein